MLVLLVFGFLLGGFFGFCLGWLFVFCWEVLFGFLCFCLCGSNDLDIKVPPLFFLSRFDSLPFSSKWHYLPSRFD